MSNIAEDIWQNCVTINNEINKYNSLSLFCVGGEWGIKSMNHYNNNISTIVEGKANILEAINAFKDHMINELKSTLETINKDISDLEEFKRKNQDFINALSNS